MGDTGEPEEMMSADRDWSGAVNAAVAELSESIIGGAVSVEEMAGLVLRHARALTGAEHGFVSSIDPNNGDNVGHTLTEMLRGACGVSDGNQRIAFPRGKDGRYPGLWGHALNERRGFIANDPSSHPESIGVPPGHIPLTSFLAMPAIAGGEVLGEIALANAPTGFDAPKLKAIERLAGLYALGLQRHRTLEDLAASEARHRASAEILQSVADFEAAIGNLEVEKLVESALRFIDSRLGAPRASVALLSADRSQFVIYQVSSQLAGMGKGHIIPKRSTVLSEVVLGRQPLYRKDIAAWEPRYDVDRLLLASGLRADYLIPLWAEEDRCLGTLNCGARDVDGIGSGPRALLLLLAPRLAQALRNAELFEEKRASEAKYKQLVATIPDGIQVITPDGMVVFASPAMDRILDVAPGSTAGLPFWHFAPSDEEKWRVREVLEGIVTRQPDPTPFLMKARCGDGRVIDIRAHWRYVRDDAGTMTGLIALVSDVTGSLRTQRELARMQKLESVGLLAGGIAHDFNNILTAVMGGIQLARMEVGPDHAASEILDESTHACERAAALTNQLLTFARGGAPIRQPQDIAHLVRECVVFALHGSNVRADFDIPPNLHPVSVDSGQIAQVIHNLVINADQAMPSGGTLRIEMRNVAVGPDPSGGSPLAPGNYLRIRLADTGTGISDEHLSRIFDPYFTTKQRGSGLGLAVCHSIILKHDGLIRCESKLGAGSCFEVFLPPTSDRLSQPAGDRAWPTRGGGRVLLMDDERPIGALVGRILEKLGYRMDYAADGESAVEKFAAAIADGDSHCAVILDLTVPGGIGGVETAARLLKLDPDVRMIVSSGYGSDPVMADFAAHGFRGVLTKPYTMQQLASVLQQVLVDGSGDRNRSA